MSVDSKRKGPKKGKGTTEPGYENRNGQVVVRRTNNRGTDHLQFVYILRCKHCGHAYGANGTDIHSRKCAAHQGGKSGFQIRADRYASGRAVKVGGTCVSQDAATWRLI